MVDFTEISAVVAAAGVLVGVIYYIWDMRSQARLRQTDMVMRLYDKFGNEEFQNVLLPIVNLDLVDSADYVRTHQVAVWPIGVFFEGVGVLVKRKLISMDLVDDLFSSAIIQFWERIIFIVKEAREKRKRPAVGEFFEYLYNEMKKRELKLQQSKT